MAGRLTEDHRGGAVAGRGLRLGVRWENHVQDPEAGAALAGQKGRGEEQRAEARPGHHAFSRRRRRRRRRVVVDCSGFWGFRVFSGTREL